MGVVWVSPSSSQRRLAHTPVRERQRTDSFRSGSAQPREVLGSAAFASRGTFSRWLRDSLARSQRMSFASLSPALTTAADGDAMSLADHERTRAALGRIHRAVRADLSTAGRSRPQGELRDP